MKKLMTVLLGILLLASVSNAATDTGGIAAEINDVTTISLATYPTNTTSGTPVTVDAGTALPATNVVTGIIINNNSVLGWSFNVTGAGVLTAANAATMAYQLQIDLTGSTGLGTGLGFAPPANLTLGTPVLCTGSATTATIDYTFAMTMTVANTETAGKLAGFYSDTITLTLLAQD